MQIKQHSDNSLKILASICRSISLPFEVWIAPDGWEQGGVWWSSFEFYQTGSIWKLPGNKWAQTTTGFIIDAMLHNWAYSKFMKRTIQ